MNITGQGVAVALAVVVALAFLFFGPVIFAPFAPSTYESSPTTTTSDTSMNQIATSSLADMNLSSVTDLQTRDVQEGNGAVAEAGDTVTVDYVGALTTGQVFDASQNRGEPFSFTLGAGQVIKGWDQGLVGMKEGGDRILVIPASLAYGDQTIGSIPANSTLVFEVKLISVQKGAAN